MKAVFPILMGFFAVVSSFSARPSCALESRHSTEGELMSCNPRQWVIEINEDDRSTKRDIASAFALIGGPASVFRLKSVYATATQTEIIAVFTVGPSMMESERFYKSGQATLERLLALEGVTVECDGPIGI